MYSKILLGERQSHNFNLRKLFPEKAPESILTLKATYSKHLIFAVGTCCKYHIGESVRFAYSKAPFQWLFTDLLWFMEKSLWKNEKIEDNSQVFKKLF